MRGLYTIRCHPRSSARFAHAGERRERFDCIGRIPIARSDDEPLRTLECRLGEIPGVACRRDVVLASATTLRVGGAAELVAEVGTEGALAATVASARQLGVPLFLLGFGSNVLVPDEGIPGLVVRLGGSLRRTAVRGERVSAGAAASMPRLARRTAERGLTGLEAFAGFPSTVGGAVYMNAGCYGSEIRDVLVSVRLVEADGTRRRVAAAELEPSYRRTNLGERGAIVTRAHFKLRTSDRQAALARIAELAKRRQAALPGGQPNAGSVFKNPPGDYAGRLIEAAGLKGKQIGGARISEKHANIIVNAGGATAADVLDLMIVIREAVATRFGVALDPEWVLAGGLAACWKARLLDESVGELPAQSSGNT